jgi:hypothetical protein
MVKSWCRGEDPNPAESGNGDRNMEHIEHMEHMHTAAQNGRIVYSEPEVVVLGRVEEFTAWGGLVGPIDIFGRRRI